MGYTHKETHKGDIYTEDRIHKKAHKGETYTWKGHTHGKTYTRRSTYTDGHIHKGKQKAQRGHTHGRIYTRRKHNNEEIYT